jgi:hypothetical protein
MGGRELKGTIIRIGVRAERGLRGAGAWKKGGRGVCDDVGLSGTVVVVVVGSVICE